MICGYIGLTGLLKFFKEECSILPTFKHYFCFSGNLYHNGELTYSLTNFTKGDYIIAVLDLDARTLSFGKNKGEITVAFENIDVSSPLYPCVVFYSNNPGEKVRLFYNKFMRYSRLSIV